MDERTALEFMSKEEVGWWGWIAGIVDGEGNIHIAKRTDRSQRTGTMFVAVAMTHLPTIERLKQLTRVGNIYVQYRNGNHNDVHTWRVQGIAAAFVLRSCLPFLFTKRHQAALALQYSELVAQTKYPRSGGGSIPESVRLEREGIRSQILSLNKKGRLDAN